MVVGGGDSAMEEAIFLTKFASEIWIVHRRDHLRASKIMQDRMEKNPKIQVHWNSIIQEIKGSRESGVKEVIVEDTLTGKTRKESCDGVFLAIGHIPNVSLFKDILNMDKNGYIITKDGSTSTSIPGVFACGDVQDHVYRQAVTAAGSGCQAAIDAEHYLEEKS